MTAEQGEDVFDVRGDVVLVTGYKAEALEDLRRRQREMVRGLLDVARGVHRGGRDLQASVQSTSATRWVLVHRPPSFPSTKPSAGFPRTDPRTSKVHPMK